MNLHICLIDDDEIYQFATESMIDIISEGNLKVSKCIDGEDAIEFLKTCDKTNHPDIILLDINMPKMNGFEFLEHYLEEDFQNIHNTTIYVVSSSLDPQDVSQAKNHPHVKDYIYKPLDVESIKMILNRE